jgi:glycosyltransferase involved in cell wall biosynthesis
MSAVISAASMFGNLSSFFWNRLAMGRAKVPLVTALQLVVLGCVAAIALSPQSILGGWILVGAVVVSRLLIAGIIQDEGYFREQVEPHLNAQIRYVGPVDVAGKNALFGEALALLHLNTIPERFGLVLAEANAAGVPVIAMDLGSCREVIADGETGVLVRDVAEAVAAVARVETMAGRACRERVERLFSVETMVAGYERAYQAVFALEDSRL